MKTIKSVILIFAIFICMSFLCSCGTKEVVGPQGLQGEQGIQGPQGVQGEPGKDGTSLLTGTGIPSTEFGKNGDSYIDLDSWDYYVRNNNEWINKGNIKGEDGKGHEVDHNGTEGLEFYPINESECAVSIGNARLLNEITIPSTYKDYTVTTIISDSNGILFNSSYPNLKKINLPNSIKTIDSNAFRGCRSLESIVIPESVTSIGSSAFSECRSLESIVIPESVTSISSRAFYDCSSLENVYYNGTLEDWCKIEFIDYDTNPMEYAKHLYLKDSNNEYYEITSLTEIEIPNTISSIGDFQFFGFKNISKVVIPKSVTNIGLDAFGGCVKLENVYYSGTLHDWCMLNQSNLMFNVEKLYMKDSNNEYFDITSMTELVIPNTVTSICAFAFSEFTNLESIVIPNSVTNIDSYAFNGCRSLTNIKIPDTVTSIGDYTFCNCTSLESIVIPSGVVSIGDCVFYGCSSVTIYFELSSQPDDWHSIWNIIGDYSIPVYWNESWEYDNEGNPIPLD